MDYVNNKIEINDIKIWKTKVIKKYDVTSFEVLEVYIQGDRKKVLLILSSITLTKNTQNQNFK